MDPMTETHDWYVEQREAFVLLALEADDMQTFEDHLGRCETCLTAVAALERDLAPLAYGVRPVAVPPGMRRRITDAVLGPSTGRTASRAPWLIAAAALFAAAASGTVAWQRDVALRDVQATLAAMQLRDSTLADSLSVMSNTSRVMQASFRGGDGTGGLVVMADERSHRWRVVVHGPAAPDGMSYLVCFITPTGLKHAVTVGRGGTPTSFTLGMPADGTTVLGAALLLQADVPAPGAVTVETPIAEVRL
jgi:hypothetical protein